MDLSSKTDTAAVEAEAPELNGSDGASAVNGAPGRRTGL